MQKKSFEIVIPSKLKGAIVAPPSKSYTHRAIICASLTDEKSKIINYLSSEDIEETIETLKILGVEIKKTKKGVLEINGKNFGSHEKNNKILNNKILINSIKYSGSSLRFLIPVAALSPSLSETGKTGNSVVFIIKERLKERPIEPLLKALKKLCVEYKYYVGDEYNKIEIYSKLKGGKTDIEGNISSQFITGLLLSCPKAENNTEITITTEPESKNYIELTLDVLKKFGIKIEASKDLKKFNIPGNQHYKGGEFRIEGDYSSAAFFLAAGAINGDIEVKGLNINSKQGDKEILNILTRMGADLNIKKNSIHVKTSMLKGIDIDGRNIPDLIPICTVLCCFALGESRIINAGRLRIKESDRLSAISQELNKMGAKITELEDGLIIKGKCRLKGAEIDPHNDHRIAMSCAIAALSAEGETIINNPKCVDKSYPDFFKDLNKLKI